MTSHDDDLRTRLSQLDPVPPSVPVDPSTSPRARELLERAMKTPMQVETFGRPGRVWRKPAVLTAAAIAVIALGVGVMVASSGNDSPKAKARTSLALKAGGSGTSMQSCMPFSVDVLKDFPVAFAATVSTLTDSTVTLTVGHWYRGGTADVVTLAQTPGNVSLDGVDFAVGKRYLLTASDGTVTSCGFSGESTPELERAFAEAFGG